ncbi:hypothetical protein J4732_08065 [Serratia marcescens]|uniref:Uncharacterized protein n=1 Tax=Serratia marcescens TaxID=615 RepID=A0A939NLR6_SERMA|nr:hypothetical protein [Serratia marcescens]
MVEMSNLKEQQRQGNANRKLAARAGIAVPHGTVRHLGMNFNHSQDSKANTDT